VVEGGEQPVLAPPEAEQVRPHQPPAPGRAERKGAARLRAGPPRGFGLPRRRRQA